MMWQFNPSTHNFTCPNRSRDNHDLVDHLDSDRGFLVPNQNGWVCISCDYTQDWAHDYMLDPDRQPDAIFTTDRGRTNEQT